MCDCSEPQEGPAAPVIPLRPDAVIGANQRLTTPTDLAVAAILGICIGATVAWLEKPGAISDLVRSIRGGVNT